ncbi:MAG: hypothetical protein DRP09_18500 [Candidatus Thorarchaeota archaeon]|nr:MAG: hypothetical protein DRP09_18500 [Candidatus Thorarchaeota archaeon]
MYRETDQLYLQYLRIYSILFSQEVEEVLLRSHTLSDKYAHKSLRKRFHSLLGKLFHKPPYTSSHRQHHTYHKEDKVCVLKMQDI